MTNKVAISLPKETFARLEKARKKGRLSRSAAVQRALEEWLAAIDRNDRCRAYIEGYKRIPEADESDWTAVQAWSAWKE